MVIVYGVTLSITVFIMYMSYYVTLYRVSQLEIDIFNYVYCVYVVLTVSDTSCVYYL